MSQATATQKPGGRRCCLALGIVNQTVHAIKHIGWVPDQTGGYRGQMAVYVKPNGLLGTGYMAAIRPFRHLILYPPMTRQIGRDWRARMPENLPAAPYKVVRRAATDRAAERSPNRAGGGSSGQPAMSSPGPFANPFGR